MKKWTKTDFRSAFRKYGYLWVGTFRDGKRVVWNCFFKTGETEMFFLNSQGECRMGAHPGVGKHILTVNE